jgi:hypothetical protein
MSVTDRIHEEMKNTLNSGNARYRAVRNIVPRLLSISVTVKFCCSILPCVSYGRENCSLTIKEAHRLTACENRVLRRMCGPRRGKYRECGGYYIIWGGGLLYLSRYHEFDQDKEHNMSEACSTHVTDEKCVQNFVSEILKGRGHYEVSERRWKDNIKMRKSGWLDWYGSE